MVLQWSYSSLSCQHNLFWITSNLGKLRFRIFGVLSCIVIYTCLDCINIFKREFIILEIYIDLLLMKYLLGVTIKLSMSKSFCIIEIIDRRYNGVTYRDCMIEVWRKYFWMGFFCLISYISSLVHDCGISNTLALEIPQFMCQTTM